MKFKKMLKIGLPLFGMTTAVAVVMPLTLTSCNTSTTDTGNNNQNGGNNDQNTNTNTNVNVISLDQYQANKIEVILQNAISQIKKVGQNSAAKEKMKSDKQESETTDESLIKEAEANLKTYLVQTSIGGHIESIDLTIVETKDSKQSSVQINTQVKTYIPKKKVSVKITLKDGYTLQLQKGVIFNFDVNDNVLSSKKTYSTGLELK